MKILSFDVGIKNLTYCLIEKLPNRSKIFMWEIINISTVEKTTQSHAKKLYEELNKRNFGDIDKLLIENQPALLNPTMKIISVLLLSYFCYVKKIPYDNIIFVSPMAKFKHVIKKPKNYKERKALSIKMCYDLITEDERIILNSHRKKDDLCDSYLQAHL